VPSTLTLFIKKALQKNTAHAALALDILIIVDENKIT